MSLYAIYRDLAVECLFFSTLFAQSVAILVWVLRACSSQDIKMEAAISNRPLLCKHHNLADRNKSLLVSEVFSI